MEVVRDALIDNGAPRPDVLPGQPFEAWRLRNLSIDEFHDLDAVQQLVYLSWCNSLAPSTHNTCPQRFVINPDDGYIDICLDRRFVLPASDRVGRQATVSLGCGITNIVLAARKYGMTATVTHHTDSPVAPLKDGDPRYSAVARVALSPLPPAEGAGESIDWVALILARKVIRAEYDERVKLDAETTAEVQDVVSRSNLEFHFITDSPTLLFLGKFQELAETTVLNWEHFAVELGEWLLEDDDPSFIGMRGAEFGLTPDVTKRMHFGLLRQTELLPDEVTGMAKTANIGMRSASAVGVVTVAKDGPAGWLEAGRLYQEIALRLWARGFCTAMHAGITEVDAPNLALRGRLRTRWRPTVLFRMGRPLHPEDWQRPHSARPMISSLLLSQADI